MEIHSMTGHPTILSLALSVFPIILVANGRSIEQIVAQRRSHDDCRNAVNRYVGRGDISHGLAMRRCRCRLTKERLTRRHCRS